MVRGDVEALERYRGGKGRLSGEHGRFVVRDGGGRFDKDDLGRGFTRGALEILRAMVRGHQNEVVRGSRRDPKKGRGPGAGRPSPGGRRPLLRQTPPRLRARLEETAGTDSFGCLPCGQTRDGSREQG